MNLRPSGYEPDELPDCSTPRQDSSIPSQICQARNGPERHALQCRHLAYDLMSSRSAGHSPFHRDLRFDLSRFLVSFPVPVLARPGDDLLSHALRRSTIGAEGLHGRVRNGIGCGPFAIATRSCKDRCPGKTGVKRDNRDLPYLNEKPPRLALSSRGHSPPWTVLRMTEFRTSRSSD